MNNAELLEFYKIHVREGVLH